MPQLAAVSKGPEDAFTKMRGRPFVMDCKFDGERVQVHKIGDTVRYFSRRGHDHGTKSDFAQASVGCGSLEVRCRLSLMRSSSLVAKECALLDMVRTQ